MDTPTQEALVARLSDASMAVELAVGERPGVAGALAARGVDVTATDVEERSVPEGVTFVRDDLTDPDLAVYESADTLYAQNLPEELQRPALEIAETVGANLFFTTLGAEEPAIPVARLGLPADTLYRAVTGP